MLRRKLTHKFTFIKEIKGDDCKESSIRGHRKNLSPRLDSNPRPSLFYLHPLIIMYDSLHLPLFPFGCNTNISSINSLSVPEKVLNTSDPLAFKSQLESCLGLYLKVVSKSTENSIFMGLTCFSILSTPCKHQSQESFDSVRVILCERKEKKSGVLHVLRTSLKEQKTP